MTVTRRGRTWSFVVWVPDGPGRRQVWRGGYRTKWEATAAERRFLVELEDEAAQVCAGERGQTVAEFLADWLVQSAPTRRPTTSVSYERCVRDHTVPVLGAVMLADLSPDHVRSWQAELHRKPLRFRDGTLSPTTVRYCHRLLRRALQDAPRWEPIERNPCDAVIAPRRADTDMQVWSPAEALAGLVSISRPGHCAAMLRTREPLAEQTLDAPTTPRAITESASPAEFRDAVSGLSAGLLTQCVVPVLTPRGRGSFGSLFPRRAEFVGAGSCGFLLEE